MAALVAKRAVSAFPWWRSSALTLRGALGPSARLPAPGHRCGDHRRLHAEDPVEVHLKRLEGKDEGIVEVLMCRHKARNALGHVFVSQMRELMSALACDSAVRAVVFRSLVPGVFCAGADLKERALMNHAESDLFVHSLRSLMTQIAMLPSPTIAAIDGVALGGGLELALACDLRTAAYSAQMGLIETTRGLLPGAGGSQRLPRTVGVTLAKELIFTGGMIWKHRCSGIVKHLWILEILVFFFFFLLYLPAACPIFFRINVISWILFFFNSVSLS
uniref:Enoyl CoA hydratase domain containing 2 n=1 Tax=Oryzias sinensis TaxID=183150 RepID=A0A8C7XME3_9TELE